MARTRPLPPTPKVEAPVAPQGEHYTVMDAERAMGWAVKQSANSSIINIPKPCAHKFVFSNGVSLCERCGQFGAGMLAVPPSTRWQQPWQPYPWTPSPIWCGSWGAGVVIS